MYTFWISTQSWLLISSIGIAIGIVAAIIDTASKWAADARGGWCSVGGYMSKKGCCGDMTDKGIYN